MRVVGLSSEGIILLGEKTRFARLLSIKHGVSITGGRKMSDSTSNTIFIAFVIALFYTGTALFFNSSKSCDVSIDYDVNVSSGIAPSISEVKFACYKLCLENLKQTDTLMNNCFKSCDGLGGVQK